MSEVKNSMDNLLETRIKKNKKIVLKKGSKSSVVSLKQNAIKDSTDSITIKNSHDYDNESFLNNTFRTSICK